jgi:hypothetical protein
MEKTKEGPTYEFSIRRKFPTRPYTPYTPSWEMNNKGAKPVRALPVHSRNDTARVF